MTMMTTQDAFVLPFHGENQLQPTLSGTIVIPVTPPNPVLIATTYSNLTYADPFSQPVFFQGNEGSCGPCGYYNVTMSMAAAAGKTLNGQYAQGQTHVTGNYNSPDVNGLYYNTRVAQGPAYVNVDSGVNVTKMLTAAVTVGVSDQAIGPDYSPQNMFLAPSAAMVAQEAQQHLTSFTPLNTYQNASALYNLIATEALEGHPVMLDVLVTTGFETESGPNETTENAISGTMAGRHVYVCNGVLPNNTLEVQSWGLGYGNNGEFLITTNQLIQNLNLSNWNSYSLFGAYVLGGTGGVDQTITPGREKSASDYVALFGRAADHGGCVYFGDAIDKGWISERQAIGFMMQSKEYHDLYGTLSNSDFVSLFYQNVGGRAVDAGGLAYWSNVLNNGTDRADVIQSIITIWRDGMTDMASHNYFTNASIVSVTDAMTYQDDGSHYAAASAAIHMVTTDITTVGVAENFLHHAQYGF